MKRIIFAVVFIGLFFTSCTQVAEEYTEQKGNDLTVMTRSLGGSDPHRFKVIQEALNRVSISNPQIKPIDLEPTHYYVRFLPSDTLQVDLLESLGINLFNHPLDTMEKLPESDEPAYDNETDVFDWIYSVVPLNFVFPAGIKHDIIYEVYLQRKSSATSGGQLPDDLYNKVLAEAMVMTDNLTPTRAAALKEWNPSVTLKLKLTDSIVPLQGVRVLASYYTDISEGITDQNGETGALCTTTAESVNYSVHWNNPRWNIRLAKSKKLRTTDLATGSNAPLIDTLADNTFEGVLGGIHRALYAYYYEKDKNTLTQDVPTLQAMMNVALMNSKTEYNWQATFIPLNRNMMHIFAKNGRDDYLMPQKAMATTFHELGHAAHLSAQAGTYYIRAPFASGESWANGVEYVFMTSFVPKYDSSSKLYTDKYTRLVESLLKNGFTYRHILDGFKGSSGWDDWRSRMREKNVIPHNNVDFIFMNPNQTAYDLRDVINVSVPNGVCKGQVVWFSLKSETQGCVINSLEVDDPNATFHGLSGGGYAYSFSTPGTKTIRANVMVLSNMRTYEKKIDVRDDILIMPTKELVTYNKLQFSLNSKLVTDPRVTGFKWKVNDFSAETGTLTGRSFTVTFKNAGKKTITLEVLYNNSSIGKMIYTWDVIINDLPIKDSFGFLTTQSDFKYDTKYTAYYKSINEPIYDIVEVNLNHNVNLRRYRFTTFKFNKTDNSFVFTIPSMRDNTMDYTISIWYRTIVKGVISEPKRADLLVSNFR